MTTPTAQAVLDWDLGIAAAAMGGELTGDPAAAVTAVTTDSRRCPPGALFVAIGGEHFDGHDFAAPALAAGASGVVVARGRGEGAVPRIEVDDTSTALRDLAVARRGRLELPVLAVTGSTGKTTTKDLLAAAMGEEAWASPASWNNEVGVPLTVLATPPGATSLVLEVGSRGTGHIAWLAPAIRPAVAVITNIGLVHLETFGTPEQVVAGKWELVEALGPGGVAVLPADDPRLHRSHPGTTVTFGEGPAADVGIEDRTLDDSGRVTFRLRTPAGSARVRAPFAGVHQARNVAAAAAAALAAGRPLAEVAAGIERARGSAWRMDVHRGSFTVVNDAYNANPDSTAAALRTVAAMRGRHLAVLGLMAELGPAAVDEHRRIGRLAAELGYGAVVVVGDDPGLAAGAGAVAVSVPDAGAAAATVLELVRPGDVVLVKGSRVAALESLALDLAAAAGAGEPVS